MAAKPLIAQKAPVIQFAPGQANQSGVSLVRVVPAWILSGIIHAIIVAVLFFAYIVTGQAKPAEAAPELVETVVEEKPVVEDLTNPDIGLNPEVPLNFNVDRIEDVSVPGAVDPTQAIGIPGAPPDAPVMSVPAPAGLGGGLGGGVDSLTSGRGLAGLAAGGLGGAAVIPGGFGGRSAATRETMVTEGGGNAASEAAVAQGMLWLALHQSPNGSWSLDKYNLVARAKLDNNAPRFNDNSIGFGINNDIAGTAFGLLPFLAGGETHKPPEDKKRQHTYQKVVEAGLRFLMSKQNREGDFGGGMYAHGLASIAMCEAFGLTSDPTLRVSAQRAIDFICRAQGAGGGWDYSPRTARIDTSVGGWQLMALKSGQMAGLNVPSSTLKGAEKWLDFVANSDKSGYGYSGPGETHTMSAVGLLCRQYLGWTPRNPALLTGVEKLKRVPPGATNNMYYYYYATQVMHHMGGDSWQFWNAGLDKKTGKQVHSGMRDHLIKTQDKGTDAKRPAQKGSWDPRPDAWGAQGGRVMITSLSMLTLEVYYRHLPLYRREMGFAKDVKEGVLK